MGGDNLDELNIRQRDDRDELQKVAIVGETPEFVNKCQALRVRAGPDLMDGFTGRILGDEKADGFDGHWRAEVELDPLLGVCA